MKAAFKKLEQVQIRSRGLVLTEVRHLLAGYLRQVGKLGMVTPTYVEIGTGSLVNEPWYE